MEGKIMKNDIKIILTVLFILFALTISVGALQFSDLTQSDFNNGTYNNTLHNETGVILSGSNLSGTYTSRIFDAGSLAQWTNLSLAKSAPLNEYLYVVDAQGKVYSSSDYGVSWILKNASYGRTTDTQDMFKDSNDNLYILASSNKEVYRSNDSGVTWAQVSKGFSGGSVSLAKRRVYYLQYNSKQEILRYTSSISQSLA